VERPRTRKALWGYIAHHFGVRLPWKAFTPGHSSPFGFVADAVFNPADSLLVWANRSGGKTLAGSLLAALQYRFADQAGEDGPAIDLHSRILSGSADQARNMYEYWANWCYRVLADRLVDKPLARRTQLDVGELSILTASQKSVRGPKVQTLLRDEVDEIDPGIWKASTGMLATRHGVRARTIDTSTWHRVDGLMGELVKRAADGHMRIHRWNVWESISRCDRDRHGGGKGCDACPLEFACRKKARSVHADAQWPVGIAAEQSCGITVIDDLIVFAGQWDRATWDAEVECKRPSLDGLVYPQFGRADHVRDIGLDPALPTYRAIDWGLNNFVCLWFQVDKTGRVAVVDEYCAQQTTVHDHAKAIVERDRQRPIEATFCDPAGRSRSDQTGYSSIDVFRSHGIHCLYRTDAWATTIANGVQLIRGALKPAAGPARLTVSEKCPRLIEAFEGYKLRKLNGQWVDDPQKPQEPFEHPMDALRYFYVNRQAPAQAEARQMSYT